MFFLMPPVKKRRKLYKQQFRTSDGKFGPKKMKNKQLAAQNKINKSEEADDNIFELETPELEDMEEWGDDDDSGWEDEVDLMCNLKWDANNEFEKTK